MMGRAAGSWSRGEGQFSGRLCACCSQHAASWQRAACERGRQGPAGWTEVKTRVVGRLRLADFHRICLPTWQAPPHQFPSKCPLRPHAPEGGVADSIMPRAWY